MFQKTDPITTCWVYVVNQAGGFSLARVAFSETNKQTKESV